ncbi:MAG TPA: 3-(methylthio)propionyl-CoA ligase [Noviherbaspirillum sp.]|nr:3-(methylthio)propionyl-CoA ligase [Noviherbaspirillum sp.]
MFQFSSSPVEGQMMSDPLLISSIIEYADRYHPDTEIVSRRVEGDMHRYTYRDCHKRARKMANALAALGVRPGERIGTLAWNGYRHLELYYAISGSGSVMHTINPRLHADQVAYIINHAEDQYLFFDISFLSLVESVAPQCKGVKGFVMMCGREHMPKTTVLSNLLCYESLLEQHDDDYTWPVLNEAAASSLCYTSGTTGNPKGALYSHRSTLLHSYATVQPNAFGLSSREVVMPVVPMFHVNAWGLPYSAPMAGAKLVLPGPSLDGNSLFELIEGEGVTFSAGVPTVWLGVLDHADKAGKRFTTFKRIVIGGSACPPALMKAWRERYGVEVIHAWGMTEMSPVGAVCSLHPRHAVLGAEEQQQLREKQGQAVFGIKMKIAGDLGEDLPWDGKTRGNLLVKGPWVIGSYFKGEGGEALQDGWFPTGDVVTIDNDGYMQITDRSKDVIKSGGEWIGSIDLENIAMAHPAVHQAACIGVYHPKWDERPLLVVEKRPGAELDKQSLLAFYEGKVARWWLPDDVVFVDALPIGATGKVLKSEIRKQFKDFKLSAEPARNG